MGTKHLYVSHFLLWVGAAISIAEIVTGTLVAPLGLAKGVLACLLGHTIGCFIFLLPAGYIAGRRKETAIESTGLAFGKLGIVLFSLLNALQLVGWTAVMIVNAGQAMNQITKTVFHFDSYFLMALILTIFIIIWLLLDTQWLFRINNLVVLLLVLGVLIIWFMIASSPTTSHVQTGAPITFGAAVELNVTMALSWLPLIGDYTKSGHPLKNALMSSLGYFLGSLSMFLTGLAIVLHTGSTNVFEFLANSGLGIVSLLIIIFSTVTTTFMDAYSAATNISNVWNVKKYVNWLAIGVTVIGFVIALAVSLTYYQNFLYLIGSFFTPMYAIVFTSGLLMQKRLPYWNSFLWWLLGIIGYYQLQRFDIPIGSSMTVLIALIILVYLNSKVVKVTQL